MSYKIFFEVNKIHVRIHCYLKIPYVEHARCNFASGHRFYSYKEGLAYLHTQTP